jgi:hypothetical protein
MIFDVVEMDSSPGKLFRAARCPDSNCHFGSFSQLFTRQAIDPTEIPMSPIYIMFGRNSGRVTNGDTDDLQIDRLPLQMLTIRSLIANAGTGINALRQYYPIGELMLV